MKTLVANAAFSLLAGCACQNASSTSHWAWPADTPFGVQRVCISSPTPWSLWINRNGGGRILFSALFRDGNAEAIPTGTFDFTAVRKAFEDIHDRGKHEFGAPYQITFQWGKGVPDRGFWTSETGTISRLFEQARGYAETGIDDFEERWSKHPPVPSNPRVQRMRPAGEQPR